MGVSAVENVEELVKDQSEAVIQGIVRENIQFLIKHLQQVDVQMAFGNCVRLDEDLFKAVWESHSMFGQLFPHTKV